MFIENITCYNLHVNLNSLVLSLRFSFSALLTIFHQSFYALFPIHTQKKKCALAHSFAKAHSHTTKTGQGSCPVFWEYK